MLRVSTAAMEEDEEWRDEEEASSAVETGCSSQSQIFSQALSLLNSFPTPPHETLFTTAAPDHGGMAMAEILCSSAAPEIIPQVQLHLEPCAKNEEDNKSKSNTHNSSSEQHKKIRSKNWTRLEMLKLIKLRTESEPKFAGGGKKMELWDEIAEALNREGISRDGQQCRDKWEKLCSGYKEVRDGTKLKEDFTLFDVLHPLLSGKMSSKKLAIPGSQQVDHQAAGAAATGLLHHHHLSSEAFYEDEVVLDGNGNNNDAAAAAAATGNGNGNGNPVTDVAVVQSLLESVVTKQQKFFRDLLESVDRRDQLREQMRQEREDQRRAEDQAQRAAFNNAMTCLAHTLAGGCSSTDHKAGSSSFNQQQQQQQQQQPQFSQQQQNVLNNASAAEGGQKKRSKNWKRAEVLQLIRLRGEMEAQFTSGTRRAAVWDELSEFLMTQGVLRDGKQCREKWDKLTAAYKDVTDGVKEACDMPYFAELSAALKRPEYVEDPKILQPLTGEA